MDKTTHQIRHEQWSQIIQECLTSGMSKTAWCKAHGISIKVFFTGSAFSETKPISNKNRFRQPENPNRICRLPLLN